MNTERLLREVERRLERLSPDDRAEVLDALREEIARERRRPGLTVEAERERRIEAETLREILEAITRQARLEDTIEEVLKQLARLVPLDSCSISLLEPSGSFRIIAARGFPEDAKVVGLTFRDALSELMRANRWPIALGDVQEDERFARNEGSQAIRSWAALPLLVEGDLIGVLCLDRYRVEPFDEEELHRAKAIAFSAAAAIRKAQLHEQVRRYAALMAKLVAVDQAVFKRQSPEHVAALILDGALGIGSYPAGMLVLGHSGGARVAVARGDCADCEGRAAPAALLPEAAVRLDAARTQEVARSLGATLPGHGLYVVPMSAPEAQVGSIVLLDPDGESPEDRLLEAYASRAALAYRQAVLQARAPA